jgi:type II secretory pathway pseudopilin PulG
MERRGFTRLNFSPKNFGGFTIVELAVVITVMGILLVLGIVVLDTAQINARDAERKTDIETIATNLEAFYTSGDDNSTVVGRYPSTLLVGTETTKLRDIDPKNLIAPGVDDGDNDISEHIVSTFKKADDTNPIGQPQPTTTLTINPRPTIATYVYQPLKSDGALCTAEDQECRKFNLYYMLEADNTVYMVTSKNQ